MRNLYAVYQSQTAPGCLQRANGKIIESTYGGEKDVAMDRAVQGMVASYPGAGPSDATQYWGSERQLPRAVGESLADWGERCRTVWDGPDGWSFGGSHNGILRALSRAGFPTGTATGVNIVQRYERYSYLNAGVLTFGTHPPLMFDLSPAYQFAQFMIVIGADFTPPVGSTFADGDPSATLFNDLVFQWKPSKWKFMGTVVVLGGLLWGWPPGTKWQTGGAKWGTGSHRFVHTTS